jgi:hypothetical protein
VKTPLHALRAAWPLTNNALRVKLVLHAAMFNSICRSFKTDYYESRVMSPVQERLVIALLLVKPGRVGA